MHREYRVVKYTLTFNEKQEQRVKELAETLGVTKADVIREALALFSVIVRETSEGKKSVQIVDLDDPNKRLELVSPSS